MQRDIDEELARETQRMHRGRKVRAMLASLRADIWTLESKEREFKRELLKEFREYERIRAGKGVASLFFRLTGSLGQKIDKERSEAVAARLKHEQCVRDIEAARVKLEELEGEAAALADAEGAYRLLYEEKKTLLLREDGEPAGRMLDIDAERERSLNNSREIGEAVSAGEKVLRVLREASDSLDSAANWGTWDILGGGLIATAVKHSRIGDAEAAIQRAQWLLNDFRTELADVSLSSDIEIGIGGFARFADYFFDGLIADFYVQGKIHDSRQRVADVSCQVRGVLRKLTTMEEGERKMRGELDEKLKRIVLES